MRIAELKNTTLSFEFFPPKNDIGFWDLYQTIAKLKPLKPNYVSITYRNDNTRHKTLDLIARIKPDLGIEGMAHITCLGSTKEEIGTIIDDLRLRKIENVLALRGDLLDEFVPNGEFTHADELVTFIRNRSDLCIGGACYPEGHPEASSLQQDIDNLKRKIDAGVEFLITQLFFNNNDFFRFREKIQQTGINVPVTAGIMPILSVGQIKRFTQMCGTTMPDDLLRRIEAVEDDAEAVRHIGMYHATQQCLALIEAGVAGIHFYTLNRSTATRAIYQLIKTNIRQDCSRP